MNLFITVSGLDELQAKADESLVRDPVQAAIEAIGSELATPKGDGKGVQVNRLGLSTEDMSATVTTSLVWPRTVGTSWEEHTASDFEAIADEALQDAGGAIEQAWEG